MCKITFLRWFCIVLALLQKYTGSWVISGVILFLDKFTSKIFSGDYLGPFLFLSCFKCWLEARSIFEILELRWLLLGKPCFAILVSYSVFKCCLWYLPSIQSRIYLFCLYYLMFLIGGLDLGELFCDFGCNLQMSI